jgi:hypothetical protein
MAEEGSAGPGERLARPGRRDEFIDFCRAFSLVVVVLWHWVFSIVYVAADNSVHVTNVLQFTYSLWPMTWLFQVIPLFFFVGGYAHLRLWEKTMAEGESYGRFVMGRFARLAAPALLVLGAWVVLGVVAIALGAPRTFIVTGVVLVVSPLWFMAVYLLLVLWAPVGVTLHRRFGPLVIVTLVGLAGLVDVARFRGELGGLIMVNLLLVWAACHQLGFYYPNLVSGPRSWTWSLLIGGLLGLVVLIRTGLYPRSMVGVAGDPISNMSPPTLAILCVCAFQAAAALLVRPWLLPRLQRPGAWASFSERMNRYALPLYLFHMTGMALALLTLHFVFGFDLPSTVDAAWWLTRPLILTLALLMTVPPIWAFERLWARIGPRPRSGLKAPEGAW